MKVVILAQTMNPVALIAAAARTCTAEKGPDELYNFYENRESAIKLIQNVVGSGHQSVLEHASVTFGIEGISRACSHQLVRHRLASYSQQSQRYVTEKEEPDWVIPPHLTRVQQELVRKACSSAYDTYQKLRELRVSDEDARFVLPNATPTNIVMTVNFRELIHQCNERLCERAQWEIRRMFRECGNLVFNREPWMGRYLEPKCTVLRRCPETHGCGRYPTDRDLPGWNPAVKPCIGD